MDVRVPAWANSLCHDKAGVNLYRVGEDTPVATVITTKVYSGVTDGVVVSAVKK